MSECALLDLMSVIRRGAPALVVGNLNVWNVWKEILICRKVRNSYLNITVTHYAKERDRDGERERDIFMQVI